MSAVDLENVRSKIDAIDKEIISLLKRRQDLVIKAASCKKALGVSAYSHEREAFVIDNCEKLAREYDLPKGLLSDIMKRVLRESYKLCSNTDFNYPRCLKTDGDVVIEIGRAHV